MNEAIREAREFLAVATTIANGDEVAVVLNGRDIMITTDEFSLDIELSKKEKKQLQKLLVRFILDCELIGVE